MSPNRTTPKYSFSQAVALTVLIGVIGVTIYACIRWGLKPGLLIGLIVFILIEGPVFLWDLATHRMRRELNERAKTRHLNKTMERSQHNPTIR